MNTRDRLAKRISQVRWGKDYNGEVDSAIIADAVLAELGWDNAPLYRRRESGLGEFFDLMDPGTYRLIRKDSE